jgi:hypothetical protein
MHLARPANNTGFDAFCNAVTPVRDALKKLEFSRSS